MRNRRGKVQIGGFFTFTAMDASGKVLWKERTRNLIPDVMLTGLLSTIFGGGTQVTTWYMGLINNSPTPSIVAADTMASHAGWAEVTAYTAPRPTIAFAAAAGKIIATSAPCSFSMTGSVTVYGAFISSIATQGGTTGVLAAAASLNNLQTMSSGQILHVDYSCSSASA